MSRSPTRTETPWSRWPRSPTSSFSTIGPFTCGPTTRSCGRWTPPFARGRCSSVAPAVTCREASGSFDAPRPLLGCGAELKNTFCVAKDRQAWVGHHIGDLKNYETLRSFAEGIDHFKRLFAVEPEIVAHDMHPDYLSTRYASECAGPQLIGVQHHHAHLAAVLAEHGIEGASIGAIYDGTGYGPDGTVWGGELLNGDLIDYRRAGMLFPVRLPGGDAAVREPWRMACSWLAAAHDEEVPPIPAQLESVVDQGSWEAVADLVGTGLNSPLTTSIGRLFDAVAALCGVRARVNYEGQAAAELEAVSDPTDREPYPLRLIDAGEDPDTLVLDPRDAIRAICEALARDEPPSRVEEGFTPASPMPQPRPAGARRSKRDATVWSSREVCSRTGFSSSGPQSCVAGQA